MKKLDLSAQKAIVRSSSPKNPAMGGVIFDPSGGNVYCYAGGKAKWCRVVSAAQKTPLQEFTEEVWSDEET